MTLLLGKWGISINYSAAASSQPSSFFFPDSVKLVLFSAQFLGFHRGNGAWLLLKLGLTVRELLWKAWSISSEKGFETELLTSGINVLTSRSSPSCFHELQLEEEKIEKFAKKNIKLKRSYEVGKLSCLCANNNEVI